LTYKWTLDNAVVSTGDNYTLPTSFTGNSSNLGYHSLEAEIRDPFNLTATTSWDIDLVKNSETDFMVDTQYIDAGFINEISFNITNTVWTGNVDITLSVPDSVVVYSDSTWSLTNITPGELVTQQATLYAPLDLLGSTGSVTLDIEYKDYLGNDQTESVSRSVIFRGKTTMIVYDEVSQYNSVTKRVTFSASVLNKGTVSAMFVNVSLYNNDYLTLSLDSASYIGELEQNDPVPFTVGAVLTGDITGLTTISVDVMLAWTDDLQIDHSVDITFDLSLTATSTTVTTPTGDIDPGALIGGAFVLIIVAVVAVGAFRVLRKKRT